MVGLSVYHDCVIGPRSVRIMEQAASARDVRPDANAIGGRLAALLDVPDLSTEAQRLRNRASVVGRIEATLALVVLVLAIMLVRGVPALF